MNWEDTRTFWVEDKSWRKGQSISYFGNLTGGSICLHHNTFGPAENTACFDDLDACVRRTAYWWDPDQNQES